MACLKKIQDTEDAMTLEEELVQMDSSSRTEEEGAPGMQKSAVTDNKSGSPSNQSNNRPEEHSTIFGLEDTEEPSECQEANQREQTPMASDQTSSIAQSLPVQQQFIIQNQPSREETPNNQTDKSRYVDSYNKEIELSFKMMSTTKIPESVVGQHIYLGDEISGSKKKLLVMDLDETLIHSDMKQGIKSPDFSIPVSCHGQLRIVQINIRPYAKECLYQLSKYYEIVVFTASSCEYANLVVSLLDPHRQYISQIFSRNHCYLTEGAFLVKDLRIFQDKALKDIVIVDNCILSFAFQLDNGIPISSYYQGKDDRELLLMMRYLIDIRDAEDVRVINRKSFRLVDMAKTWSMSPLP